MMVVVVFHITAAIVMSFIQKENLPKAMVTGMKKSLDQKLAIKDSHLIVGLLLLVSSCYFFWSIVNGDLPQLTS